MLIFCCQELDRGAVLVHAAALGPIFGLTDASVDNHQMCSVMIQEEEEEGEVGWNMEISLQLPQSPDD